MLLRQKGIVLPATTNFDILSNSLVVFLHIEKTAGMTIRRMLFDIYGREQVLEILYMSSYFGEEIPIGHHKAICGHFHANSHLYDQLPYPFVHFTILRNPIDRVLSEYYYFKEQPKHVELHALANTYSLEEIFEQEIEEFFPAFNWMCYHLSGVRERNQIALDCAKWTLSHDMTFFGFVQNLPELAQIGRRLLGWKPVEIHRVNTTQHKENPSFYAEELIEEYNQFDMELYKYAMKIYRERRDDWLAPQPFTIKFRGVCG